MRRLALRRHGLLAAALLALPLVFAACDPADGTTDDTTANAALFPPEGSTDTDVAGSVLFRLGADDDDPVTIEVDIEGLTPGRHGLHIHENPTCDPADLPDDPDSEPDPAGAAGEHWDPLERGIHGDLNSDTDAKHLGDLGNVTADQNGVVRQTLTTDDFDQDNFFVGDDDSTLVFIGRAVIVHSGEDDLQTEPAGNSGERIGCGRIALALGGG